jgi:DNA-binding transcriptional MocR family regulator
VDLSTVTRAYAAARALGLLEGVVGRGTFVRAGAYADDPGIIDLSMNLPPAPSGISLSAVLRETIADILEHRDAATLMAYHPGFGSPGQRTAAAQWIAPCLPSAPADRLLVAPGAQAALSAVFNTICEPGDIVLTDALTYPGFLRIARQRELRLLACPTDRDGILPDELEALCRAHQPAAIYLSPTLQNPMATTLPPDRRRKVGLIAASNQAWIVEDDPYSRLLAAPPAAIATYAPDWTIYVATLSKCLSPGLRIAYLLCPETLTGPVEEALRAATMMPPPLMSAVTTRWIVNGEAERLLRGIRTEARARRALAAACLPQALGPPESLHVWLPRRDEAACERLRRGARDRGLAVVTSEVFAPSPDHPRGARISLGAVRGRPALEDALNSIAELIAQPAVAAARDAARRESEA